MTLTFASGWLGYHFIFGCKYGPLIKITILSIVLFIWAFILMLKLNKLDNILHVYKRKSYLFLLLLPFFILNIVSCLVGNLCSWEAINEAGKIFYHTADFLYYWTIFIPLNFGYYAFYYFTISKAIKKICKKDIVNIKVENVNN